MSNLPNFGQCLSLTTDFAPTGGMVSGNVAVGQALIRRILTPSQGLIDDPTYGYDVSTMIDSATTNGQVDQIMRAMDQQFLKDQRVQSSKTTGTFQNQILTTSTTVVTALGPFSLVLAISAVSVTVLSQPT